MVARGRCYRAVPGKSAAADKKLAFSVEARDAARNGELFSLQKETRHRPRDVGPFGVCRFSSIERDAGDG